MTLTDDLIAARALIDTPEKWIRGLFYDGGCYCILGALNHVHACDGAFFAIHRALPSGVTVPEFNDDPSTTHAHVLALFDRAIAASRTNPEQGVEG